MFDFCIVGAGVIGCAIARELSKYDASVIVIDANSDVCMGASGANSGIVHAGYDCEIGSVKAKMNILGNSLYRKWAKELSVPLGETGSMVIATDSEELDQLKQLFDRGIANGVQTELIDRNKAVKLEANLADCVVGALFAPTAAIVNPFEMTVACFENARENGVQFVFNCKPTSIVFIENNYIIESENSHVISAKIIINAAGVGAQQISELAGDKTLNITARLGEYILLDKVSAVSMPIFQAPTKMGKGILVSPTTSGNIFIGPTSLNINEYNTSVRLQAFEEIKSICAKSIKNIPFNKTITSFAGVRAVDSSDDFVIGYSKYISNFYNVAGICSPGLTAAPAIAEHVSKSFKIQKKNTYNPFRRDIPSFKYASNEEKKKLIETDPLYGKIVCRCETVSEAQIIESIKRGATTIDGVKRRTRCGMGRCNGGFCMPTIAKIIARELNIPLVNVMKNTNKSWIVE